MVVVEFIHQFTHGRSSRNRPNIHTHRHRDRGTVMLGTTGHSNYHTHTHRDRSIKGPWCSGQLVTRTTTHTHTETGASRGRDARDNWSLELAHTHRDRGAVMLGTTGHSNYYTHTHTHRDRSIKGPWCSGQLVTRTTTHTPRQGGRDARDNWSLELLHTHRDRSIKGPWCSGQLVTRTTTHTHTHRDRSIKGPWCSGQLVTRTTAHTPRQEHQGAVMLGTIGHSNYCTHTETGASRGRDARDNWSLELLHTHRDRSIKGPWCSGQLVTRTTTHTPRQEHQGAVMLGTIGHSNYYTHTETGASRGRDARDNW